MIDTILPLLGLVQSSSAAGDLANKAASILHSRLGKAKATPSISTTPVLHEVHQLARKAPKADFCNLCSVCSVFLVRSILDADSSIDTYRASLRDFVTRKSSQLHPNFLLDYVRRFPSQAWALRDDLLNYLESGAVNSYRQSQVIIILQTLISHIPTLAKSVPSADVASFVSKASERIVGTLRSASSSEVKSDRIKELAKLALHLARASKSVNAMSAWNVDELAAVVLAMKAGQRTGQMKGVLGMLAQLQVVVEGKANQVAVPKRKQEDDGEPQDTPDNRKTVTDEGLGVTLAGTKPKKKRKSGDGDGLKRAKKPKEA